MKILFTGGGTGGHIFPIIAVAREIRRIHPAAEFFYIGPKDEFGQYAFSQEDIKIKTVPAGKLRRYVNPKSILANIVDLLFRTPMGILRAFFYIFYLGPDVIFSNGGYGSIPATVAGWILGVPIFLHESDAIPGKANRFAARFAWEIFISFRKTPYFPEGKMILIGNPIRREIMTGDRKEALEFFKLDDQKPTIVVFGGSQGAQRINDVILEVLPEMLKNFYVIHQTGEKNYEQIKKEAAIMVPDPELRKNYRPFSFLQEADLKDAYAVADLIISRAGSGSIFEIAAAGKPSILVPLTESAQNHQSENAYGYAEGGAAVILEEGNFSPHFLLERIKYIFARPEELIRMTAAAKSFSRPLAAKVIAEYLVTFLTP